MAREPGEIPEVRPSEVVEGAATFGASEAACAEAAEHGWRVLAVLSALMAFASISTDLYLPAMPAMGRALGASAGMVEWTVSSYLIGFGLGQLLWGPIGDRYGRRLPVALGLGLFIIGSAGCALAGRVETMIAWRVVQAVGACAGVVLSRAMVRDLYAGHRAAQMMSTLLTVMAIAPLLGPLVGAQILHFVSWRAIFWTLVGVGFATLLALWTLPETLPPERRNHEPLGAALGNYFALLGEKRVMSYGAAGAFFYAGVFAYVAGSPFAYMSFYHVRPEDYAVFFGVGSVGIMATNILNARLVMRYGSAALLRLGSAGAALAVTVLVVDAETGWGGLAGLAVPLLLFISMAGLVVANSIAGALAHFPERAGAVSALVGAMQYGSGVIGSGLVGGLANGTPGPLGWVMAVAGLGSAACAWFLVPKTCSK